VFATATRASVHPDPATESGVVPGHEVVGRIDIAGRKGRPAPLLAAAAIAHRWTVLMIGEPLAEPRRFSDLGIGWASRATP